MRSNRKALSNAELKLTRDMGAATYLSSYVWLMAQELKVTDDLDNDSVNAMAVLMLEPLNFATQAAFCMLMKDTDGANRAMKQMNKALNDLRTA